MRAVIPVLLTLLLAGCVDAASRCHEDRVTHACRALCSEGDSAACELTLRIDRTETCAAGNFEDCDILCDDHGDPWACERVEELAPAASVARGTAMPTPEPAAPRAFDWLPERDGREGKWFRVCRDEHDRSHYLLAPFVEIHCPAGAPRAARVRVWDGDALLVAYPNLHGDLVLHHVIVDGRDLGPDPSGWAELGHDRVAFAEMREVLEGVVVR